VTGPVVISAGGKGLGLAHQRRYSAPTYTRLAEFASGVVKNQPTGAKLVALRAGWGSVKTTVSVAVEVFGALTGAEFGATCPQASPALVNKMGKHAKKILFIEGFPVPQPLLAGIQKLSGTERSNPDPLL